jgi:putative peptide maturation dehydrogenase
MQIRRTHFVFFAIDDVPFLDIELLLRGQVALAPRRQLQAVSILKGRREPVGVDDVALLFGLAIDAWTPVAELLRQPGWDLDVVARFLEHGLVVGDSDDADIAELRRRDEQLTASQWNLPAALYHFMGRWSDIDVHASFPTTPAERDELFEASGVAIREYIAKHGKPPPTFHSIAHPLARVVLPVVGRDGGVFAALARRRTTRAFDRDVPLAADDLALLLHQTFGCHGYLPIVDDVLALRKTSPSGGSLHPTEVYVLARHVSGLAPGLHHYNVRDHALDQVAAFDAARAADLADELTAGQSYTRDAQALFLLTARFYRSYWKYRNHPKAYGVLLMDAGHLSQTFYLVCAELGLGAFVTAAINSHNIEKALGLDGFDEGAIAILGCGAPAADNHIDPRFLPYTPGGTNVP